MDFKVAGTREFVTALQLDTKLDGIPASVLGAALTQAHDARIDDPRRHARGHRRSPTRCRRTHRASSPCKIPVDQIGAVIGPKGKIINQIQDDTGAQISIEDDGTIYVGATDGPAAEAARTMINAIANPTMPEKGERYLGTVVKTTNFGAFVSLLPGQGRPAAHLASCGRSPAASGSRTSRTSSSVGRRSRSRSPRSTTAASCH